MARIPYLNIVEAVFLRPWAVERRHHALIQTIVIDHVVRGHLPQDEIDARIAAAAPDRRPGSSRGAPSTVGVIPIQGTIMPRAAMVENVSASGTAVESIQRSFRAYRDDPEVDAIVFDIASPGGIVDGVPELAAEIRASRGVKPMVASANAYAASAAYWLASQADELWVTPSGDVGSIGVFTAHEDWSKYWDDEGIRTTLVHAGKYKVEGNQFEPLTDEARAYYQERVDEFYGMFVRDVAAGRGVSASDVRAGFGQGRMVLAKQAVAEKMADRVGTLEEAIGRAAKQGALNRRERERQAVTTGTTSYVATIAGATSSSSVFDTGHVPEEETVPATEPEEPATSATVEVDPEADDGEHPTDDGDRSDEAAGPGPDFYAVRARRRDREAVR